MIKRILVASVARSDFSITLPVIKELVLNKKYKVAKIVSSTNYINNKNDNINDTNKYDYKINNNLKNDSPEQVNEVISNIIKQSSTIFNKFKPDLLILTGDRYEMLSLAVASISRNLPIAHIHGGEVSLGSFDERSRHSITKLSQLHFPATKKAAERIKKMGEFSKNITISGAPALDGFLSKNRSKKSSFLRLSSNFNIDINDKIILITFHPVTIDFDNEMKKIDTIFNVLSKFKNKLVFTSPGADPNYKIIYNKIHNFISKNKNAIYVSSFGDEYYFDILNVAKLMFGNSSSGIIEAASFKLPVVNVGKRQLGRETSKNVLHANLEENDLLTSINKALSIDYTKSCKRVENIYYHGGASKIIVKKINSISDNFSNLNNLYNL